MKIGINYWTLGGFEGTTPVAEAAKAAKAMGYDAIELCFGAGELTPETNAKELGRIRSDIESAGIELSSLASGNYWAKSLSSPDEAERGEAIAFTEAYIKAASALGAGAILVIPGSVDVPFDPSRPVVPANQARELSAQSIRDLLPLAERQNVVLALENVWNKFLTGPFEFKDFVDSFQSEYVKAYFDAGNVLISGYPEHWVEILGASIGRVHVKNFQRQNGGGTLDGFTDSLYKGDLNWSALFEALKGIGYDSYLIAEMLVSENGLPDMALAEATCREMQHLLGVDA